MVAHSDKVYLISNQQVRKDIADVCSQRPLKKQFLLNEFITCKIFSNRARLLISAKLEMIQIPLRK